MITPVWPTSYIIMHAQASRQSKMASSWFVGGTAPWDTCLPDGMSSLKRDGEHKWIIPYQTSHNKSMAAADWSLTQKLNNLFHYFWVHHCQNHVKRSARSGICFVWKSWEIHTSSCSYKLQLPMASSQQQYGCYFCIGMGRYPNPSSEDSCLIEATSAEYKKSDDFQNWAISTTQIIPLMPKLDMV